MNEFEFIRQCLAPLAGPGAFGLGDDAAAIASRTGHDIILTADAVVGGVHFLNDDPPALIARKALRVNLSDLAAKGAAPIGFLMTLSLPRATPDAWLRAFCTGLASDIAEFGIPLLGGDTTATPGPLTISITALGEVPAGAMVRRSGAQSGDRLCVTGTLGDAALGLACLENSAPLSVLPRSDRDALIDRYRLPRPRLPFGLAALGLSHAGIDVSDGLIADVGHVCDQSKIGAVIERDRIPLSDAARTALAADPSLIDYVLTGGDDYELALAVPERALADAMAAAARAGTPLSEIGRFEDGTRVRVLDRAGMEYRPARTGYRHF